MRVLKIAAVVVTLAGVTAVGLVFAPSVYGQSGSRRSRELTVLAGRGAELGVRVADAASGVEIEGVEPDSAAEKAGLKRGDVIVEFDGERIRSGRQFARVVQETPAGRTVKATVVREGQKRDIQITPSEGRRSEAIFGDQLREQLGGLDALRRVPFDYDFDFDLPGLAGMSSAGRLGITVDELTNQLAGYFGAKDGVLIASVTDGSGAARAGLKAGDVITSINGQTVGSRQDLLRGLREAADRTSGAAGTTDVEVTIGIVRDKKESSVKAKIESTRRSPRSARPV
jgi:serine protease Do